MDTSADDSFSAGERPFCAKTDSQELLTSHFDPAGEHSRSWSTCMQMGTWIALRQGECKLSQMPPEQLCPIAKQQSQVSRRSIESCDAVDPVLLVIACTYSKLLSPGCGVDV